VDLHVTTGWRSAAYQQVLFDDAVREYGGPEAARAHVLRPDESEHVTGDAVDIGPTDAMYWLARHGSDVGLCQTYGNEIWHFELAVEPGGECPPPAADPSAG
jgi:D-alanyl-D-alanine carboxypeptidase